jgi:hypothetical protein
MNTAYTASALSTRLASASFAAVLTLAMLLGVGTLADVEVTAAQMAQAQAAPHI